MYTLYSLAAGPFAWAAFIIFIGGGLFQIVRMAIIAKKKDSAVYDYMSLKYGARSIFHWLIPFGTASMKGRPLLTAVSFLFHICLLFTPVFLYAHVLMIDEAWNIAWITVPDQLADALTLVVIAACVFFFVRRLKDPTARYLTTWRDYAILLLVAAPFITGFWSFHQFPGFKYMGLAHMLSGELMLAAIPFTRLSHMFFFFFTRAYIGSEFGGVRHARDW